MREARAAGLDDESIESLLRATLRGLKIPLDAAVGTLSGGQRAQVALALTLAKRPCVLLLVGPRKDTTAFERDQTVVQTERTARQTTMLVRLNGPVTDPDWEAEDVSLEDMVLGYMGADAAPASAELTAAGGKR